jgi:hypothetical protein
MDVLPAFFAAAFYLIAFKWKSPLMLYLCLLTAGFVLMCGYLKWEPWQQRLQLVFLLLAAPFAGAVLGWVWHRWLVLAASMLLVWNGLLVVFYNHTDPMKAENPAVSKSREERYFALRPDLYGGTAEVAQDLINSGVTNVLLKTGLDSWEYPLWVFLQDRGFRGTIHHVFVENDSAKLPGANFDVPGSAIVTEEVNIPPQPNFGLSVSYDSWTVHYRGKTDNRMKLIGNHASLGLMADRPGRLQIRCHVIDQHEQPVTNNILHLQAGDFSRDYPLATSEDLLLECPLKPGRNLLTISGVNPPSPEQRILILAGMTTKLEGP